jgi:hypothetical protein
MMGFWWFLTVANGIGILIDISQGWWFLLFVNGFGLLSLLSLPKEVRS